MPRSNFTSSLIFFVEAENKMYLLKSVTDFLENEENLGMNETFRLSVVILFFHISMPHIEMSTFY